MLELLKKRIIKELRDIADKIESNTCELDEEEAAELLGLISHTKLNKEQACIYLNLGRSRFDDLVRDGVIPKGHKKAGTTAKYWYRDELDRVNRHI